MNEPKIYSDKEIAALMVETIGDEIWSIQEAWLPNKGEWLEIYSPKGTLIAKVYNRDDANFITAAPAIIRQLRAELDEARAWNDFTVDELERAATRHLTNLNKMVELQAALDAERGVTASACAAVEAGLQESAALRCENAALRANLATAKALSPWFDDDAPGVGQESQYFQQFLRESEGE